MYRFFRSLLPALFLCSMTIPLFFVPSAIAADQPLFSSIVVKLKPGLTSSEQQAVIARDGGVVKSTIPTLLMYVVEIPAGQDSNLILQNYQSDLQVERAEPGKQRQAKAQPNDTLYVDQWSMPRIGWENVYGRVAPTGNATVALLDTGVYANHPDLGDNVVLQGISMLDGSDGRTDNNGHGTRLAGIIGAVTDNGTGIAGVCTSGVKILPVTVLNADGIGSDGDIIAGIVWAADHGADLILMGFSSNGFSQNLQDAIDYAWGKGAVLVAAAGNDGVEIPAFPAGNRGVIGVSATDRNDQLFSGSNYGQSVFLAAPGENIATTGNSVEIPYAVVSGTSASSAIVAGVGAFMKAVDPTLTNGIIASRLARSADAIGSVSDPALNTSMFGNGRINMANALASTSTLFRQPEGALPIGNGGPYVGPYVAADDDLNLHAYFSESTTTIMVHGEELHSSWVYQYAYKNPSGAIVYHGCRAGYDSSVDQYPLPAGYQAGTWTVYLYAYNPYYTTCLNDGSAPKTASRSRAVAVTSSQNVTPSVTAWPSASAITFGQSLAASTLSGGSASVPGRFTFVAPATMPNAGIYAAEVIFIPTDTAYNPVNGTVNVTVNKAIPAVTSWPVASSITYGQALSASTLSGGVASVAGTFSFAAPSTVPNTGSYTAAVVFTPVDTNYDIVGGNVTVTVNNPATQVTSWPTAGAITYGQALSASTLTGGGASVPGSFAFAAPSAVPNAGVYSAEVVFVPTDPSYNQVTGTVTVTVNKATPTVTSWPTAGAITYGQSLSASTLSGGTGPVAGTFAFVAPTTLPNAGSYNASVIFTPANGNYDSVTGSVTVAVAKAVPTVTAWPTAGAISYGQQLSTSILAGGSASVGGNFAFAAESTVPNAGIYQAAVIFTPTDGNYDSVTGSVSVTVNKAMPSVSSWPTASAISYGQALSASSLTGGTGSVAGIFAFAAASTVPNAGIYQAAVIFTPTDGNYDSVTGSVTVAVAKVLPTVTTWPVAGPITYGQPLSASILNGGSASVNGSFAFVAPDTMLNAGGHSVAVIFTPVDTANYHAASGNVGVNVSPAGQTIGFGSLSNVTYGVSPLMVTATASSGLAVGFNSLTPGVCTVSGAAVTLVDVGICSIEAIQAGSNNYYPAAPVVQSFAVTSAGLHHFALSGVNYPQTAGTVFNITITAQDLWNHTVTSFAGTVDLSTTAGAITPAATQQFVDGIWTGPVSVTNSGTGRTITATSGAISGTSTPFDVNPGSAVAFTVTAPSIIAAGVPFDITVTAKDANNNTAAGYVGTVHFTSTDPKIGIAIPADYSFQTQDNGSRIFTAIVLQTAGVQTITASDTTTPSISGTSGSIAVNPAGAAKLSITAPPTATAGMAFDLTVRVKDAFDNDITGYVGTIGFMSNDPQALLPGNYSFLPEDNGSHTFVAGVTLKSSGIHTVAATDLQTPGITGTSGSIAVNPAAATMLVFSRQPTRVAPGQPIVPSVVLNLLDQYGNVASASTTDVTIGLSPASHTGTLSGTTTRQSLNGVATFDDLAISPEGNGYQLTATAGALPMANSLLFDVIAGTCGKPSPLTVPASNDTGTIPVSWGASDVVGVTYTLEQSIGGGAFAEVYRGTTTSANIVVAMSGSYLYRVKAIKDGYLESGFTTAGNGCVVSLNVPPPSGLIVPTASSTGSISIRWTASTLGGVTYVLEQSSDGVTFAPVYSGTGTSAVISVIANGTYTYRVKGTRFGYSESSYVAGSNPCVARLACGKPSNLIVPATNSTGLIPITWTSSDVYGAIYILEQSQDGVTYTEVYNGTNTSAAVSVTVNGTYYYRVKATKPNYDPSDYVTGTAGCAVHLACGKPATLTVPATNSTGIIAVNWGASDVVGASYVLEQSRDGVTYSEVYNGTNRVVAINLSANGTYYFRVKATKPNYDSSDYTVSNGCVVHLACGKPASITVPASNSTGIITISWDASDVVEASYVLEQSQDGVTYTEVYSGTNRTVAISVNANGTYFYRVKAMKPIYDASDYTTGIGCVVHLACGKPQSLNVPATNSTGMITVSWGASDVVSAGYVLEMSQDGVTFNEVYRGTNTSAAVSVTSNGTYHFRVKATKQNYDPSGYTAGTGCVVHLACGKPGALTVPATNSTGMITVNWGASDVIGVTYLLEQSQDGVKYIEVYTGPSASAAVPVAANGTYFFRVKATKQNYDPSDYTIGTGSCVVQLACGKPGAMTVPATNSTGIITVSWGAGDVVGVTYLLEQSQDGVTYTEVYSGTNASAAVSVNANGTYYFRVKATKPDYEPSGYTVGTACVVRLACGKPGTLTVPAANSTGMIILSWGASDVIEATYVLEQSQDGVTYTEVYSGTGRSAAVTVTSDGTYFYRVKVTKPNYDSSGFTVGTNGCIVSLVCGRPASITVPAANSSGMITVSWDASDVVGATYVLEQSQDGVTFTEVYRGTNRIAAIYVNSNGIYHYRVKAQKLNYVSSDWTVGGAGCAVTLFSKIKINVSLQPDIFYQTVSEAVSAMPVGTSVLLNTWETTLIENLNFDKPDTTLTIGAAYDSAYKARKGPVVIQGVVTVSVGTLVVDSLVIR